MSTVINDSCIVCYRPGPAVMCAKCRREYKNSAAYSIKLARWLDRELIAYMGKRQMYDRREVSKYELDWLDEMNASQS